MPKMNTQEVSAYQIECHTIIVQNTAIMILYNVLHERSEYFCAVKYRIQNTKYLTELLYGLPLPYVSLYDILFILHFDNSTPFNLTTLHLIRPYFSCFPVYVLYILFFFIYFTFLHQFSPVNQVYCAYVQYCPSCPHYRGNMISILNHFQAFQIHHLAIPLLKVVIYIFD